jgi:hypothetical protein
MIDETGGYQELVRAITELTQDWLRECYRPNLELSAVRICRPLLAEAQGCRSRRDHGRLLRGRCHGVRLSAPLGAWLDYDFGSTV